MMGLQYPIGTPAKRGATTNPANNTFTALSPQYIRQPMGLSAAPSLERTNLPNTN
jgi:hypothetical protein